MPALFGTDGIRGTTDKSKTARLRLTPALSLSIGQAVGELIQRELSDAGENLVVIGRDPRISGWMIENALTAGLLAQGVPPVPSLCAATFLHGLAADRAAEEKGAVSLMAGDLLAALPGTFTWLNDPS